MAQPDYERTLRLLMNEVSESVAEASDEDILEDVVQEGMEPGEIAENLRKRMLETVKAFRQSKLHAARKAYKEEIAALEQSRVQLPSTPAARRSLFHAVIAHDADLRGRLTVQFRDLDELSDSDIESCLRQLRHLGVLDDYEEGLDENS